MKLFYLTADVRIPEQDPDIVIYVETYLEGENEGEVGDKLFNLMGNGYDIDITSIKQIKDLREWKDMEETIRYKPEEDYEIECPTCGSLSKVSEWDNATLNDTEFTSITLDSINKGWGRKGYDYVCPVCEDMLHGTDIVESLVKK